MLLIKNIFFFFFYQMLFTILYFLSNVNFLKAHGGVWSLKSEKYHTARFLKFVQLVNSYLFNKYPLI